MANNPRSAPSVGNDKKEEMMSAITKAGASPRPENADARRRDAIASPAIDDVTPEEFRAAFRNHPAGVAVITADAGAGPVALTATSVFSVSVAPPLLVFSISELSSSAPTIRKANTVVVHLLGSGQIDIAKLGATSGIDRFADTSIWTRLPTGEPYFPAAHAWIRGRVVSKMEAGGSTVVAVQALETHAPPADDFHADAADSHPLVYHNRTWHRLSESSKID